MPALPASPLPAASKPSGAGTRPAQRPAREQLELKRTGCTRAAAQTDHGTGQARAHQQVCAGAADLAVVEPRKHRHTRVAQRRGQLVAPAPAALGAQAVPAVKAAHRVAPADGKTLGRLGHRVSLAGTDFAAIELDPADAALAALAAVGRTAALYPGSWSEWCADDKRPIESGEEAKA